MCLRSKTAVGKRTLHHEQHHDQYGGKTGLRLRIGIDQDQHAARGKTGDLARGETALERVANDEGDANRKHGHVVHIKIRRGDERAGCERRRLELIGGAASPQKYQPNRDRSAASRLYGPGQGFAAAMGAHETV